MALDLADRLRHDNALPGRNLCAWPAPGHNGVDHDPRAIAIVAEWLADRGFGKLVPDGP